MGVCHIWMFVYHCSKSRRTSPKHQHQNKGPQNTPKHPLRAATQPKATREMGNTKRGNQEPEDIGLSGPGNKNIKPKKYVSYVGI